MKTDCEPPVVVVRSTTFIVKAPVPVMTAEPSRTSNVPVAVVSEKGMLLPLTLCSFQLPTR